MLSQQVVICFLLVFFLLFSCHYYYFCHIYVVILGYVTMSGYWQRFLWWHNDVVYVIIDVVDGDLAAILIGNMLWRE